MRSRIHKFRIFLAMAAVVLGLAVSGCTSSTVNTKRGTAIGAGAGAILGGIIGHQSGRGLEGAAIGAGAGAILGGVTGSAQDEKVDRQSSYGDDRYRTYPNR